MAREISAAAQVAIVGSAATYRLAKAGWSAVLFERKKLTSGTTSRIYNAAEDRGSIPEASNPCRLVVKFRERATGS